MPGARPFSYIEGHNVDPFSIERSPRIIDRTPTDNQARRATSETRTSRRVSWYRFWNPLTRRYSGTRLAVQRTRAEATEESPTRGRPSSHQPAPPVILPTRSRSTPPVEIITRMPASGQPGHVPLPPKIPKEGGSDKGSRDNSSGRESQQSHRSQTADDNPVIIERTPRPYSGRQRSRLSESFDAPDAAAEPSSPRHSQATPSFEYIQPNETIRSRPREGGEVYRSKEYIKMKEIAEYNRVLAEDAAQRCAKAEIKIQNLEEALKNMTKKADKSEDDLQRALAELYQLRKSHRQDSDELKLKETQAKLAQDQLHRQRQQDEERVQDERRDRERRKGKEKERTKEYDTSGSGNGEGSGGRRRRRGGGVDVHQGQDAEPRTPNPRSSTTSAAANTTAAATSGDAGWDAIRQAKADLKTGQGKA